MKWFKDCKTCEDVKQLYRKLAKELHPDCGGDAEMFKAMFAEYTEAFERLKTIHVNREGETYEKDYGETAERFANIINKVIHFDGVVVEIIGSWVWLTGSTLIYKDAIKEAGFWWSSSKKAWYWNGSTVKSRRRGRFDMNGLRSHWGSTVVKEDEEDRTKQLA